MSRISGMNFDINVGDMLIHVETATLDITDNSAAAQTGGVPDGWVDGDVSASGELELDTANFNLMIEAARKAGSFRRLSLSIRCSTPRPRPMRSAWRPSAASPRFPACSTSTPRAARSRSTRCPSMSPVRTSSTSTVCRTWTLQRSRACADDLPVRPCPGPGTARA